ncbi:SRPBCC family protein [Humibacter ginsenosidimutans]|uniref:SRPBCC domain-containing protein n=1 Tax=Humibacter ginsenosidimutans TaxID=2599293 RepID=A0A5B8M5H2_9MICO|nr:SRPBCC domain-containing protein [Humibacter ginsenosidimutans]QDZ15319.1 SRPBCC domain-containing protein [Humibacter ginsenosidimutans]
MIATLSGQTLTEAARSFTLTRVVDAPPADVYRAWTEADHLAWYFNPERPVPTEPIEVDARPGGCFRVMMDEREGKRYWSGGRYLELVPARRIVFEWGVAGGWPDLDEIPSEKRVVCTVALAPVGDGSQTEHVFTSAFPAAMTDEEIASFIAVGMREGWATTIARLLIPGR